ncbi:MAG: hypothetical protein R3B84_06585 [Zavarzinella sp.]
MEISDYIPFEICHQPENLDSRLAFAQTLQNSNDPASRAWGEFIDLQLKLDGMQESAQEWPQLISQERDLLKQFHTSWEKPLRNILRPRLLHVRKWLTSQLFGTGGSWGYRNGLIENIRTSAAGYLYEDSLISGIIPLRRAVLSHASYHLPKLYADKQLGKLATLYLIADAEIDDDCAVILQEAEQLGLKIHNFLWPEITTNEIPLLNQLRKNSHSETELSANYPIWATMDDASRLRLRSIADSGRFRYLINHPRPGDYPEYLDMVTWVFLGDLLYHPACWAIVKGHHDLQDELGRVNRYLLTNADIEYTQQLAQQPYFKKAESTA